MTTNKSKTIDGVQYKQCGTCKKYKPVSSGFYKLKHGGYGVSSSCIECHKQSVKEYRKAHPGCTNISYKNNPEYREKVKKRSREWRRNHPEYAERYKREHPDRLRNWVKAHPTYFRDQQRRFRKANPDYYRKLQAMRRND